ncbi:MAG: fluoride efflux transporter CrcB [Bacteroidota bacterium]
MKLVVLIFVGGGLGSVVRYLLHRWVSVLHQVNFPFGTLAVNIVACFVLGLIIGLADHRQFLSPDARIFWAVGFCGGFSTFSTFTAETLALFQQPAVMSALVYIAASVLLCLASTMLGIYLGK